MGFVQRIWNQDISSESKMYADSVYMYDAGNFVGLLTLKGESKQWSGFTVVSRVKTLDTIEETLEPAHEFAVPMHFYSVEKYPAIVESSTLWIPGWKLQMTQLPHVSEALGSQTSPRPSSPRPPLKQHTHQGQNQPSLPPAQSRQSPSFPSLPKSPSEKQVQLQHPLQNKSNTASRQKALPSSNPTFHAKPKQSIQGKSGGLPLPSSQVGHISPLSQPHPISQPSPCLQPPSTPGESNPRPTSSSPNQSNLKRHLSSQQARRRHEGKSQHPSFSQQSSHE